MTKRKVDAKSIPSTSWIYGFLFSLPFLLLNCIVALRIQPFYSWLELVTPVRRSPMLPLFLLLLFPVGAYVAARPMIERKKFYLLNSLVAVALLIFFFVVFPALSIEAYRCDVLVIPNCD
jgi:hypothetical protein